MTKLAIWITVVFVSLAILGGAFVAILSFKVAGPPAPTVERAWIPPSIVLDHAIVQNVGFKLERDSDNNLAVQIDNYHNKFPSHYRFHVSLFRKGSKDRVPIYEGDIESSIYPEGGQSEWLPKQKYEVDAKLSNIQIKN